MSDWLFKLETIHWNVTKASRGFASWLWVRERAVTLYVGEYMQRGDFRVCIRAWNSTSNLHEGEFSGGVIVSVASFNVPHHTFIMNIYTCICSNIPALLSDKGPRKKQNIPVHYWSWIATVCYLPCFINIPILNDRRRDEGLGESSTLKWGRKKISIHYLLQISHVICLALSSSSSLETNEGWTVRNVQTKK